MLKAEKQERKEETRELPPEGLAAPEQQILDALTERDVRFLKILRRDNLTKEKRRIVGVRSEDLFFLLESIHKGFVPAERETDPGKYYVAANPESPFILTRVPEAIESSHNRTFMELTRREIDSSATFDVVKHAVERSLISGRLSRNKLLHELRYRYRELGYNNDFLNLQEFCSDVADDLTTNPGVLSIHSGSRPALALLSRLMEAALPPEEAKNLLRSLTERKGVLLAFNEKLLQDYQFLHADHDNMVVQAPAGQISLDTLLGFESLGDYEDSVLRRI